MSISFSGSTLTFSDSTTMTTAAVAGPPGPTGPAGSPSSVAGPTGSPGPTGPTGSFCTNNAGGVGSITLAYHSGGSTRGTTYAGACIQSRFARNTCWCGGTPSTEAGTWRYYGPTTAGTVTSGLFIRVS